jgi:hypothetical protein
MTVSIRFMITEAALKCSAYIYVFVHLLGGILLRVEARESVVVLRLQALQPPVRIPQLRLEVSSRGIGGRRPSGRLQ